MSDSPYTTPESSLVDDSRYNAPVTREKVDLGEAFGYAFKTDDWLKRCLIAGLMMIVPLVGPIVLLGWSRHIHDCVMAGDNQLPEVDFSKDLNRGFPVFGALLVNFFPIMFGSMALMMVGMVLSAVIGGGFENGGANEVRQLLGGLVMVLSYGLMMVVSLGSNLLMPEIWRRAYNGEIAIIFKPGASFRAVKGASGAYMMALVAIFVGGMVGGLGVLACYVGMFLTLPLSYTIIGHAVAQYDQVVRHKGLA